MNDNFAKEMLDVSDMRHMLTPPPRFVGHYELAGLQVHFEKKPIWLHRKMMALCLGWKWRDAE